MAEKTELTMEEKIDKAVTDLLAVSFRPGNPPKPDEALKSSQALLNMAHARQLLVNGKK